MSNIKLFEDTNIRAKWNDDEDKWYFVVQDVIAFLTESTQPAKYWSALKNRVSKNDGFQLSTICRQLKFEASDGKTYRYESTDNEGIFRILQSVSSPRAEPFKRWLAKLGKERLEEIEQPGKAIERAKNYYTAKGYHPEWVESRVTGIGTRNELTKQFKDGGITEGKEYAILTNELTSATFGMDTLKYKYYKGITKSDSLRDNMNPLELVITMLSEATAKELAVKKQATGFTQNKQVVQEAGKIANDTIKNIEKATGIKVSTTENFKHLNHDKKTQEILDSETKSLKESSGDSEFDNAIDKLLKSPKK